MHVVGLRGGVRLSSFNLPLPFALISHSHLISTYIKLADNADIGKMVILIIQKSLNLHGVQVGSKAQ